MVTFAYITDGKNDYLLSKAIVGLRNLQLAKIEILIIGDTNISFDGVKIVPFDESFKDAWITRKKNLIAQFASFETLVIMHDYVTLNTGWDDKFIDFLSKQSFDAAICRVMNLDGSRFRDWTLWPFDHRLLRRYFSKTKKCILPYSELNFSSLQYISGSVFICKRSFLRDNPLNEQKTWGQGEDVDWAIMVRERWNLSLFNQASFKLLKQKDPIFLEIDIASIMFLRIYLLIFRCLPVRLQHVLTSKLSLREIFS